MLQPDCKTLRFVERPSGIVKSQLNLTIAQQFNKTAIKLWSELRIKLRISKILFSQLMRLFYKM